MFVIASIIAAYLIVINTNKEIIYEADTLTMCFYLIIGYGVPLLLIPSQIFVAIKFAITMKLIKKFKNN